MEESMTVGVFAMVFYSPPWRSTWIRALIQAMEFFGSIGGKKTYMQSVFSGIDINPSAPRPKLVKGVRISSTSHFTMDVKTLSIRKLLKHCLRTNNETGWNEFVKRIEPTIAGVVYRQLSRRSRPDPGLVQDLVQETFLKLFDKDKAALKKFKWQHEKAIYGYVKVIARHVVDDYKLIAEDDGDEFEKAMEVTPSSEADLSDKVQCAEFERSVEKLAADPMEKDIFRFRYRYGYSAREIGEMPSINIPVKRVETIIARLLRQVRAEIKRGRGNSASSE